MSEQDGNAALDRALDLVRFLRERCPWDARQTPSTLVPYLLEEAHEAAEAIGASDDVALEGELGDLLLNVAFQIVLAEERRAFHAEDVVRQLEAKMRRRHPHLYGDGPALPWEELKARERARTKDVPPSLLAGLVKGLDPLSRAQRMQDRVSAVGFDWGSARGALDKVAEEVAEVEAAIETGSAAEVEEELGDLLFSVVNVARLTGAHAMRALEAANRKFTRRFMALEALARDRGLDLDGATLEQMDVLWNEVKRSARNAGEPGGEAARGTDD